MDMDELPPLFPSESNFSSDDELLSRKIDYLPPELPPPSPELALLFNQIYNEDVDLNNDVYMNYQLPFDNGNQPESRDNGQSFSPNVSFSNNEPPNDQPNFSPFEIAAIRRALNSLEEYEILEALKLLEQKVSIFPNEEELFKYLRRIFGKNKVCKEKKGDEPTPFGDYGRSYIVFRTNIRSKEWPWKNCGERKETAKNKLKLRYWKGKDDSLKDWRRKMFTLKAQNPKLGIAVVFKEVPDKRGFRAPRWNEIVENQSLEIETGEDDQLFAKGEEDFHDRVYVPKGEDDGVFVPLGSDTQSPTFTFKRVVKRFVVKEADNSDGVFFPHSSEKWYDSDLDVEPHSSVDHDIVQRLDNLHLEGQEMNKKVTQVEEKKPLNPKKEGSVKPHVALLLVFALTYVFVTRLTNSS